MIPPRPPHGQWGRAWLEFWFTLPSTTVLAVLRIGVGLALLYSLFAYSFDLTDHLAAGQWGDLVPLRGTGSVAWPFSVFDWHPGAGWIWTVHIVAMVAAMAFMLGIFPNFTGLLTLILYLSYGHRNPAAVVPLDGLLVLALLYLVLSPCGRDLAMVPRGLVRPPTPLTAHEQQPSLWGSFMLRLLQVHLCLLYFLSGLTSLDAHWLSGEMLVLTRPLGLSEAGALRLTGAAPVWAVVVAHGLTLLSLFYGVFVWLRRFRYPLLALVCVAHLAVGIAWGLQTYNLLMIVLNGAFLAERYYVWLKERLAPYLLPPWFFAVMR